MDLPVNKPTRRLQRVRAKTTILWPDSTVVAGVNEAVNDGNSNQKKEPVEHWVRRFIQIARFINGILHNEELSEFHARIESVRSLSSKKQSYKLSFTVPELRKITAECEIIKKWKVPDYKRARKFIEYNTKEAVMIFEYLQLNEYDDTMV